MSNAPAVIDTTEVWLHKGNGLFVVNKVSGDGSTRHEPISGQREFQISPEDRRAHQAVCKSDQQDPFRNGTVVPVNDAAIAALEELAVTRVANPWSAAARAQAVAQPEGPIGGLVGGPDERDERIAQLEAELAAARGQAPAATSAPAAAPEPQAAVPSNMLTAEEELDVLKGNGMRAKALLARLDAPTAVELLHARAVSGESTENRIKLIEDRWAELDPNYKPVRRGVTVVSTGLEEAGPQAIPDDGEGGPLKYALEGIDDEGTLDPDTVPLVPGEGVPPGTEVGVGGSIPGPQTPPGVLEPD